MTPYYADEHVTLYCGDCREVVPQLNLKGVAASFADPPYGETSLTWDKWPDGWPTTAWSAAPVLWCFGSFRMFWDQQSEFDGWRFAQDIVWEKQNGSGSSADRFRRVHELSAQFYRANLKWADVYKSPVYVPGATKKTTRRKKRPTHWGSIGEHLYSTEDGGPKLQESVIYSRNCHGYAVNETQKPEALVAPLLQYSVPPGGLVLDLFSGSGTVLAQAREQGKRAIGIELRESQCEAIVQRLAQHVMPLQESKA